MTEGEQGLSLIPQPENGVTESGVWSTPVLDSFRQWRTGKSGSKCGGPDLVPTSPEISIEIANIGSAWRKREQSSDSWASFRRAG